LLTIEAENSIVLAAGDQIGIEDSFAESVLKNKSAKLYMYSATNTVKFMKNGLV